MAMEGAIFVFWTSGGFREKDLGLVTKSPLTLRSVEQGEPGEERGAKDACFSRLFLSSDSSSYRLEKY